MNPKRNPTRRRPSAAGGSNSEPESAGRTIRTSFNMDSFKESVTLWATVIGTALTVVGLVQSRTWLTAISLPVVIASIALAIYAKRQRQFVTAAEVRVDDVNIDSLNVANLRRRLNRSLVIQEADHFAMIDGQNLTVTLRYAGYCRAKRETAIEFSIDTDNNIPFERLDCVAFNLGGDPRLAHQIRPLLVGPDGISKKLAVPLLRPLASGEPFSVMLTCKLPGCMNGGTEYYTSTVSFDQPQIRRFRVRLKFLRLRPDWLRVYQCDPSGDAKLVKALRPAWEGAGVTEYLDFDEDMPAQSARIYVFRRSDQVRRAA